MDKKLTLSLNSMIIEKAKGYAKNHGTSLSKMIENYLSSVIESNKDDDEKFTPLVNRLIGVIDFQDEDDNMKLDYSSYLMNKYK
ncbi:hypothetical protein CEQ90_20070 [Lewinellaceae bacterium SD302]|nr:hypothetical protein CEQ90_20070 [Lewinellaceae bacterium SD302]